MDFHLETILTLDSLLVLGGEGEDRSRSNHAYRAHSLVSPRDCPLYIVLSGSHSGLSKPNPIDSEAETMRKYLRYLGVPNEDLATETKAQDTLGNMVFF